MYFTEDNHNQSRGSILFLGSLGLLFAWIIFILLPGLIGHPDGLHFIRQTDSLSFVFGYHFNGLNFFTPSTLNLSSEGGRTACEFPIYYYVASILSNNPEHLHLILKLLHLITVLIGLFFLAKTIKLILNHSLISILITSLAASSTIFLYYAGSTLPDAPALGLSMIGSYYGIRSLKTLDYSILRIALIWFAIASLIKITYAIYPIAFIAAFYIQDKHSLLRLRKVLISILFLTPCLLWSFYVNYYNLNNSSTYFLTSWAPIWIMNPLERNAVLDYLSRFWSVNFYYITTQHVFLVSMIVALVLYKKIEPYLFKITALLLLGGAFYLLLFYQKFKDHDYYLMIFIPSFTLVFVCFWNSISRFQVKYYSHHLVQLSLFLLVILSHNYAYKKLNQRFNRDDDNYSMVGKQFSGSHTWLNQILPDSYENVLVIGDHTMNGSLVNLHRRGITYPGSSIDLPDLKYYVYKNKISHAISVGPIPESFGKVFTTQEISTYNGVLYLYSLE